MRLILFSIVFISGFCIASEWNNLIKEKKYLFDKYNCELLIKQFIEYRDGNAPAISDNRIKSITIEENNDIIIDIKNKLYSNVRINMLPNPSSPFNSPDCNAGFVCSSMMRKAVYDKLLKTLEYLDILAPEFGYASGEVDIVVFEALRDVSTQKKLFQKRFEEIKKDNPDFSDEQAEKETSKWVSPTKNNIPVHSTGAAIDIRLKRNGEFLDMGKFGAIWGANPNCPTFSENINLEQKLNRLLLLMATNMSGLTNYLYEFWHYSYGDRYYVYWNSKLKTAYYNCVTIN